MTAASQQIKACCAAAYGSDAAGWLLGDTFHPGGLALTRRLAQTLDLRAGQRVLDVASGRGGTARLVAEEYGVRVDAIDLSTDNIARATAAGVSPSVRFQLADAERLPFPADTFDAVICECALCLFPDKPAALAEIHRVLVSGGRVGVTDLTIEHDRLPEQLRGLAGWVACVADARTLDEYLTLTRTAGLTPTLTERHDDALAILIDRVAARLRALDILGAGPEPVLADLDLSTARTLTELAGHAVTDGIAGYVLLVAHKGQDRSSTFSRA